MLCMQFANVMSLQTADEDRQFELQSQSQRSRGRHLISFDEFDIYVREPVINR
jgi:hypothetical protein